MTHDQDVKTRPREAPDSVPTPHPTGPLASDYASSSSVLLGWVTFALRTVIATGRTGLVYTIVGTVLGATLALLLPPQYTSAASFIAQGTSGSVLPSALQGLAASVGIGAAKDYSPQFYADLATSDPVLTAAIKRSYQASNTRGTYAEMERLAQTDSARSADAALRFLHRRVTARADVRTNIITLSVTARYPELSRDVTQAILDALDSMNISFRQEQSRELRQFFESRVADAQRELDSSETVLRRFIESNRAIQNSPLLAFEQMRLTRTAELKRAVYTTVLQHYEEARMQEARNVPVLTVLSPPTRPVRKSGPPRRLIAFMGLALGLTLAVIHDWIRAQRINQSEGMTRRSDAVTSR